MSRDRTRTRDRPKGTDDEFAAEFEVNTSKSEKNPEPAGTDAETSGLRKRLSDRAGRLFSPKLFVLALVLTLGGLFAASTFIPLPGAGLIGVFLATFLFGLVVDDRRYSETIAAGGIAAAASTLLDFAVVAFLGGFGVSLAILAGILGAAIGGIGTYFGRDLRNGLTRDL